MEFVIIFLVVVIVAIAFIAGLNKGAGGDHDGMNQQPPAKATPKYIRCPYCGAMAPVTGDRWECGYCGDFGHVK